MDPALFSKLREFNLNSYESRIWVYLLSRGVSTAGELSDMANVPRSRSYDVLESLEKKGFVIMKHGKPIKYIAVPPNEVLDNIKKKVVEKTRFDIQSIDSAMAEKLSKVLNTLYEKGNTLLDSKEIMGSIRGRKNILNHLETMIKNASKSVIIISSIKSFTEKAKHLNQVFSYLTKNGVNIRIALNPDKNSNNLPNLDKSIEIRKTDLNLRLCIVDRKEILMMIFSDVEVHHNYDIGIWAANKKFCKNIELLFDNVWKKMPIYSRDNKATWKPY